MVRTSLNSNNSRSWSSFLICPPFFWNFDGFLYVLEDCAPAVIINNYGCLYLFFVFSVSFLANPDGTCVLASVAHKSKNTVGFHFLLFTQTSSSYFSFAFQEIQRSQDDFVRDPHCCCSIFLSFFHKLVSFPVLFFLFLLILFRVLVLCQDRSYSSCCLFDFLGLNLYLLFAFGYCIVVISAVHISFHAFLAGFWAFLLVFVWAFSGFVGVLGLKINAYICMYMP